MRRAGDMLLEVLEGASLPSIVQRYVTLNNGRVHSPVSAIQVADCACLAIAQTKPDNSRAIAAVITVGSLPARASLR
jgi:hypothetical protein